MEKGFLIGNIASKVKNIDKKTYHDGCTGSNEEGLATAPKDASDLGTGKEDPLEATGLGPDGDNLAAPKPMSSNSTQTASMSFANVFKPERAIMKTNFRSLFNSEPEGDLRKFSDIGACNPTSDISNETIANPNAQIVEDDMVRVQVPREVPSFDKSKPQSQPLPNCPPLDAGLGTKRGLKPPIKPQSLDSFRMKVLDNLTINPPPSSLVASFHLRDLYCYYRPCIDDPKKLYRFKPGLLGHSGSLGVDFSKLEMIDDD
nr:hypothetical protein [Tanacetum cinerariifolium]